MASKSNKDLVNIPSLVKGSVQIKTPFITTKYGGDDGVGSVGVSVGNGSNNESDTGIGAQGTQSAQTIAEQIAGSSNPELAFQQYLYQTGLENIFTQYQKNIANLDSARQKDIADAYFIREMSKKYLGEYASNIGIGDVSGNLIDIYSSYAENISGINANYNALKSNYEAKMLEESQKTAQQLLGTEVSLQLSEYADTMLEAQNTIINNIQTGDWGDFDNYEDYVNSLDLPDKQKQELIDWAEQENTFFEQTSFVQIQGVGVNQTDLERFGLTAQENLDVSYYTNENVLSGSAYVQNGIIYGVASEATDIPASELEGFNYRKDGNGFITYKGDTYVYMADGTFHKMVSTGMNVNQENGSVDSAIVQQTGKHSASINGIEYVNGGSWSFPIDDLTDEELLRMGLNPDWTLIGNTTFSGRKVFFYNGRYVEITFRNGKASVFVPLVKK